MAQQGSCDSLASTLVVEEKPEELDAEILGRKRPDVFSSTWIELIFVGSMLTSLAMADFFMGGFQVVLPQLIEPLDIPEASRTWPASVMTLVAGALLFPCGRLADMFGGYLVFHAAFVWFMIWTVVTGFSTSYLMLVICRALQGVGLAAVLPSGIAMLGRIYRPGPRKNLVFSLYGALSPLGFFVGIIVGGMSGQLLTWRWYFWLGAILSAVSLVASLLTAPRDYAEARKRAVSMDWWGVCTIVPGLVLVIYGLTDSQAGNGWASPQIIISLILGVCFLAAAVYVEGWKSSVPLLPAEMFRIKYMKRMLLNLFLVWGSFSIYLFYANFYINRVLLKEPLLAAAWFAPWGVGGLVLSTVGGLLLHLLPGRALLIMSAACKVLAVLLFAIMPDDPNYWAWVFPAMLAEAACVDVMWTVSNVYLTTSLPHHLQGLAGALINFNLFIANAFFLAIVGSAVGRFKDMGLSEKQQYQGAFWIGVCIAVVALILSWFVKLGKAGCQVKEEQEQEESAPGLGDGYDMSAPEQGTPKIN